MACFDNEKPKYNVVTTPYILFAVMQRDRSRQVQVTKVNQPQLSPLRASTTSRNLLFATLNHVTVLRS